MNAPQKFVALLDKLIADGHALLENSVRGYVNDGDSLHRWSNELILLQAIGSQMLAPWGQRLAHHPARKHVEHVRAPLSALEAVKYAVDNGLLVSYRELVLAEEFSSLLEQGAHLLSQGYIVAAAVIFRAVLEERLRDLCNGNNCLPEKDRPTINDLNQALYKCEAIQYDKAMMLNITALAAIGNNAAHNLAEVQPSDAERLKHGLLEVLVRYSV